MKSILAMNANELRNVTWSQINRLFSPKEFFHIARTLGALWTYDYDALEDERPGLHAELKSGRHSDGFFSSAILLEVGDMMEIVARQLVWIIRNSGEEEVDFIAGIPKSATDLGQVVAELLCAQVLPLEKDAGGNMFLRESALCSADRIVFLEDVCTRGTAVREGVRLVLGLVPEVTILPIVPVILNRGGLDTIEMGDITMRIAPIVDYRMNDWDSHECPLCQQGSEVIKPKALPGNWQRLVTSQLPRQL